MRSCAQDPDAAPEATTIDPATARGTTALCAQVTRELASNETRTAPAVAFRRALAVLGVIWAGFLMIDAAAVRWLDAGQFLHFVLLRGAALAVIVGVLARLRQKPPPPEAWIRRADLVTYTSAAIALALMCCEFGGIASPYAPGLCLVMSSRTVSSNETWRQGLAMNGIPIAAFFALMLGFSVLDPAMRAQLSDPGALTMAFINTAFVFGTFTFLVGGGHIVWSLRRQVFEARSLGRYRLKRRIAAGGMGDVWVAYHPGLKRDVAIKILRSDHREDSASAQARFEREVRATAELNHPNTVRVFDYGATEDGLWYYVMELLEGETLAELVRRGGALAPARAVHLVGQVARALGEAHDRGIVHRDVKPENLFVTSLGGEHDFVKVIDFGIAKIAHVSATMTEAGSLLGTPAYMSPEAASGQPAGPRSDVYSLGAVLYFLLCGRPPFEADGAARLIVAHVTERVVPPSERLGRRLPPALEEVVMRALRKDPDQRYTNACEMALALASCEAPRGRNSYAPRESAPPSRPPEALARTGPHA